MWLLAVVTSVFSDICKIQALVPVLAAIQLQSILLVVSLCGVLSDTRRLARVRGIMKLRHAKAFAFLTIWVVLSVPFSVYPGASTQFLIEHYWKFLITYCLVVVYGSESFRAAEMLTWAVVVAVSVFSVGALFSGGDGRFFLVEAYDPNDSALLLVVALPMALWKLAQQKRVWKQLLMATVCLLIPVAVIRTESRGGFLGLVAVMLITIPQVVKVKRVGLSKLLMLLIAMLVVIKIEGGSAYLERISSIFQIEENYNYTADTGRIAIWKQGLAMMVENPLFGVGVSQFVTAHGIIFRQAGGKWQVAHNSFIQVGAELGLPGLIGFSFLTIGSIVGLRSAIKAWTASTPAGSPVPTVAYALIGSWVGYIVCGFFLSAAYTNIFYILLGLSHACTNLITFPGEEAGLRGRMEADDVFSDLPNLAAEPHGSIRVACGL